MKSMLSATFALVMGISSAAMAVEKNACVEGYKAANAKFFAESDMLRYQKTGGQVAQGVALGGGLFCIAGRRSIGGVFVCTLVAGAVGVGGYVVANLAEQGDISLRAKYQMEDAFLIYQAYVAGKAGVASQSPDVDILLRALNIEGVTPQQATAALAEAMESGDLCDENGQPSVYYPDMVDLVKVKL